MTRIALTGYDGFLGTHVRYSLLPKEKAGELSFVLIERDAFVDASTLAKALSGVDAVVHLAGMNRGSDEEVYETNVSLARTLVEALDSLGTKPRIAYASSTHIERDSAYGHSKKEAGDLLLAWGAKAGAPVAVLVFPHIFGEFAKPFYNSAVATLCHQLAGGEASEIAEGASVELVYAGDAAHILYGAIASSENGERRVTGIPLALSDVYARLSRMHEIYMDGVVPSLSDMLDKHLFATLHSVLFEKRFPLAVEPKSDERGILVEIARHEGEGQAFFSTTVPGKTRGDHYHTRKIERFCVVGGIAEIRLRKLLTSEVLTFPVSGDKPVAIDMPTYYAHSLVNTGSSDVQAAFWINERYNPEDPDTFAETV